MKHSLPFLALILVALVPAHASYNYSLGVFGGGKTAHGSTAGVYGLVVGIGF